MGHGQTPLNDRIVTCERELLQLKKDGDDLDAEFRACLPASYLGIPGQLMSIFVSSNDARDTIVKLSACIVHRKGYQQRIATFRRMLGILENGSREDSRIKAMHISAGILAGINAKEVKELEETFPDFARLPERLRASAQFERLKQKERRY